MQDFNTQDTTERLPHNTPVTHSTSNVGLCVCVIMCLKYVAVFFLGFTNIQTIVKESLFLNPCICEFLYRTHSLWPLWQFERFCVDLSMNGSLDTFSTMAVGPSWFFLWVIVLRQPLMDNNLLFASPSPVFACLGCSCNSGGPSRRRWWSWRQL